VGGWGKAPEAQHQILLLEFSFNNAKLSNLIFIFKLRVGVAGLKSGMTLGRE